MALPSIYSILETASKKRSRKEKIEYLRSQENNKALLTLLKYTFHPDVEFDLPPGAPPYKECEALDIEERLYQEVRKLYVFNKNTNLSKVKKEAMFIQILESIDRGDAKVLLGVKDKKLPFKGITEKLVKEAFPTLL